MALFLRRITDPYECKKCSITKKLLAYGDEYYYDPDDGTIIDFEYYYDKKFNNKVTEAEYQVTEAMNRFSYQETLRQKEREFLEKTMFDRPLADQNCLSWIDSEVVNKYINNIDKESK